MASTPSSVLAPQRAWATINLNALRHNFAKVRELCPHSEIIPVIKSNAYGHGMLPIAQALLKSDINFNIFAVATLQEALDLKKADLGKSILLMAGCVNADELQLCCENEIEPIVHSAFQEQQLLDLVERGVATPKRVWIKFNTGMNRLGQRQSASIASFKRLSQLADTQVVLMSHLAFADDMSNPESKEFTEKQIAEFAEAKTKLQSEFPEFESSFAASAGILTLPETHEDHVRPGVMLYGSSPLARETGPDVGLRPVMTLKSRLMAINLVPAGESVGYNATYTCRTDSKVGVVSIGYGDGYPRSATNKTPVLVRTASGVSRTNVIGRVSMDMITIDLSSIPDAAIDDEVILWGEGLAADEVAKSAGTIAYELFCKVTSRTAYTYED